MSHVDPKYVAPAVALGLALVAGAVSGREYFRNRAFQEPVPLACDRESMDEVEDGLWVQLQGCTPMLDEIVAVTAPGGDEISLLLIPLKDETSIDGPIVAVLSIADRESLRNAQRWTSDLDRETVMRQFDLARLEGETRSVEEDDFDVRGFEEFETQKSEIGRWPRAIDRRDPPDPLQVHIGLLLSAICLPLGLILLLRATRKN